MATLSSSVTLDRGYFETLPRKCNVPANMSIYGRTQFHSSGSHHSTPADLPMVTIPKCDYDGLLASSREYGMAASQASTPASKLYILVNDETPVKAHDSTANLAPGDTSIVEPALTQARESPTTSYSNENGNKYTNYGSHMMGHTSKAVEYSGQFDDIYSPNEGQDGYFNNGNNRAEVGRDGQFLRNTKRTVLLSNIPEAATHADVTDVIKGGILLDVFLRSQDRAASVSFLDGNAANDFFAMQNATISIFVAVSWSDRHFTLANHVAHKIGMGATRNIVIRSAGTRHTDESIREDLDHIHNLVVVSIKFVDRDAHVSTNSVHNAMFARTCMMSRSKYKGCKIEWDIDECAAPIPVLKPRPKERIPPKAKAPINRFALLNMDGATDDSIDEDSMLGMDSFQSDLVSGLNGVAV
ncbi:hypothetical protein V493_06307 [Pseudogymnoascus sp. VKM F-4281 (FW-2241)]|nr:hypothetical protein V493_06307 [Pseudogymnoascus sp. VKM F-4281 (FW-2241)]